MKLPSDRNQLYIYTLLPEFLMRFLIWLLMHTLYRVKQRGLENLPTEGAAVVVCNHVSFVDACVLAAASRRPIRFVMDHAIFKLPVLRFIFTTARAIPIAPRREDPAMLERAFEEIGEALDAGDLVCIFPEGKITSTGELNPFRPGIERIVHPRQRGSREAESLQPVSLGQRCHPRRAEVHQRAPQHGGAGGARQALER